MNKLQRQVCAWTVIFLSSSCLFAQWDPDLRLTYNDSISSTFLNYAWCIAATGDTVHIVWDDNRDGNWEVYYIRSLTSGSSWGLDTLLSEYPANSMHPAIGACGANVHLVWSDERDGNQEIYYKRSTAGGAIWEEDVRLTSDMSLSASPSLAVCGNTIHIVWHDERNGISDIYYMRSTDQGITWSGDTRLTQSVYSSLFPAVAASDSIVHVVWFSNMDIYYIHSFDGGVSWEPEQRLTYSPFLSLFASIAASDSIVHVVWHDQRSGNMDIFYKRSMDNGMIWSADTCLTAHVSSSNIPALAVSGDFVHVVWYDNRDGNYEIYYKRSSDSGAQWGENTRLTEHPATSKAPCIALSNNCVHLVWLDERDGNYEIYYKRNPTGNLIEEDKQYMVNADLNDLSASPNPFSDRVLLKYVLKYATHVRVKVYDASGRLIKTLVNRRQTRGTYSVQWRDQDLADGAYFIELNDRIVKKIIKVKNSYGQ